MKQGDRVVSVCVCVGEMGGRRQWADRDVTGPETKRLIVIHQLVSAAAPALRAAAVRVRRATTSRGTSGSAFLIQNNFLI